MPGRSQPRPLLSSLQGLAQSDPNCTKQRGFRLRASAPDAQPMNSMPWLHSRAPSASPPVPGLQAVITSRDPAHPAADPCTNIHRLAQPWGTPATLLQPLAGPEGRALRSLTGPRRAKRHAAPRRHHAHLMRVGCSLGTCQVQNLGHRLWQLMGQSGRQDSSPMNPNSPHSYG
uniref:Adrenomedullin 2 n=1 Tax=Chelydra serpentina TaxID=8475 RepID=A0A8C3SZ77_CHESE